LPVKSGHREAALYSSYSYENWLKFSRTSIENCKNANNTRLHSSGDLKCVTVRNGRHMDEPHGKGTYNPVNLVMSGNRFLAGRDKRGCNGAPEIFQ